MHRYFIAAALLTAAPAFAQDVPTLDVTSAVAQWKDLEGQKIRLTGGKVSGAKSGVNIAVYGAYGKDTISIDTTGVDAGLLATLDATCGKPNTDAVADCAYDVIATMGTNGSKTKPRLKEPEFVKP